MRRTIFMLSALVLAGWLTGCRSGVREDFPVLPDFNVERYLGQWYEIARIDHRFEKGMDSVTARYWIDKGKIRVENRGYLTAKGEWKTAHARAERTEVPNILEVSFFPMVWAAYAVLWVDPDYSYALVGSGYDYLWVLARERMLDPEVYAQLLERAEQYGFNVERMQKTVQ